MAKSGGDKEMARQVASAIHEGFCGFLHEFEQITARSESRFEKRDWSGNQQDGVERLELYGIVVARTADAVAGLLGNRLRDRRAWLSIKPAHMSHVDTEDNGELAQTFYNSVARRIFDTVGVDADIEYVSMAATLPNRPADAAIYRRFECRGGLEAFFCEALDAYRFEAPYEDQDRDARLAAAEVHEHLGSLAGGLQADAVEILWLRFFRLKCAFLIGRIRCGKFIVPLVLSLRHDAQGVVLDAVLMGQNDVSILFSFTRSYFHVSAERPLELVLFLQSILPLKPVAELYIALGWNKHGKTELYRDLQRRLLRPEGKFEIAPGNPGMVMIVFDLEAFESVFKVIRDRFAPPKKSTRRQVIDRYRLVFQHDRVGRLIDAQEFEHLEFERARFADDLLEDLVENAGNTVTVEGDRVVISHLYTERKVTPLNLYLDRASESLAARAVIDYGNAIKELAVANIFPGDFLLKNFGVTRHGRVVFYDYDELCLLTECKFRRLPPEQYDGQEMEAEAWFTVADNDVFPEEFHKFLGMRPALADVFNRHHSDLYTVAYWRALQDRHQSGEIPDFYPYHPSKRLNR